MKAFGRVFMMVGSLLSLTSPVGLAVAGPVSDALGLRVWYLVAGVLASMGGMAAFFIPALVHVEDNHAASSLDGEDGLLISPAPAAVEAGE
jgi:DHA3 family macrolide efflux protein-like MFS transporter